MCQLPSGCGLVLYAVLAIIETNAVLGLFPPGSPHFVVVMFFFRRQICMLFVQT